MLWLGLIAEHHTVVPSGFLAPLCVLRFFSMGGARGAIAGHPGSASSAYLLKVRRPFSARSRFMHLAQSQDAGPLARQDTTQEDEKVYCEDLNW